MTWTIFDYGVGNLHSLDKALRRAGATTKITTDPAELVTADVAVLPGVGAFGHVMESLAPAVEGLRQRHAEGRPILGVCIGMQAMFAGSDESPGVAGLGLLPEQVVSLPASAGKIPHMGWNTLENATGLASGSGHVYYVHTYAAPVMAATTATTTYGMNFSAALEVGNTIGFQFHPEKSSAAGQKILQATVEKLEKI